MKEATGELNSTLIVVIAIAALMALFLTFIFPYIQRALESRSTCANAVCDKGYIEENYRSYCYSPNDTNKSNPEIFECPYRG